MLSFNVAGLLKEATGATRHHELSGNLFDIDAHNAGPVAVTGEAWLTKVPRGIMVQATVHLRLTEICTRCLELSTHEVEMLIEEEYVPSIDVQTGLPLSLEDNDEPELLIDAHHILDLTEVLRQYAIMEGTGRWLCSADCKGLCPICGANLNTEPCTCQRPSGDPRLAVLAQLLHQDESR